MKTAMMVVIVVMALLTLKQWPEISRYLKMKSM
jgi:hypothetical protein